MTFRVPSLLLVVLALLLGLAFLAPPTVVVTSAPPASLRASAVDLWRNYSDPASDVVKLYTSNLTPVVVNGAFVMSPFPDSVNILWLRSGVTPDGRNATVTIEVKGSIADLSNTTYEARLYSRSDNGTHFVLDYTNTVTTLRSNATGASTINLTGNSTITSTGPNPTLENTLTIRVAMALLGSITAWNLDASATQLGPVYSYRDFGWDLPGNPGSTPTEFLGIVTDMATGAPLAGVNVSAGPGIYTTTNATGGYALPVAAGTYNLSFRMHGYYVLTKEGAVTYGSSMVVNAQLQKLSLLDSLGIWLWVLVALILLAVALATFLILRRRARAQAK